MNWYLSEEWMGTWLVPKGVASIPIPPTRYPEAPRKPCSPQQALHNSSYRKHSHANRGALRFFPSSPSLSDLLGHFLLVCLHKPEMIDTDSVWVWKIIDFWFKRTYVVRVQQTSFLGISVFWSSDILCSFPSRSVTMNQGTRHAASALEKQRCGGNLSHCQSLGVDLLPTAVQFCWAGISWAVQ